MLPTPAEFEPPAVLSRTMAELRTCFLHRTCNCLRPQGYGCGITGHVTLWPLAERLGDDRWTLAQLVPRLRCDTCQRRPTVILAQTHVFRCSYATPPGWAVVLSEGDWREGGA